MLWRLNSLMKLSRKYASQLATRTRFSRRLEI